MNGLVEEVCVPMPLQIVIDDVGWWSGKDGNDVQEPFRTGIDRNHVPEDYTAIARLGRELGMRPQAAFILGEWDRENILRAIPSSTWMGANWDNSRWIGPWLDNAARIIRDSADCFELTLHGLGHEYWHDGTFTRAEWHDQDGNMRPADQVLAHLDAYERIMRQNDLGDFPTSFVPAAFLHCYGDGDRGLVAILKERGITFISTPFSTMHRREELQTSILGIDQGITTVDRGTLPPIPWDSIAADPGDDIPGPILGFHWPNILHPDPAQNATVVDRWVEFLRSFGHRFDRLLSPDTAAFQTQLSFHLGVDLELRESELALDFAAFQPIAAAAVHDHLTLKVKSPAKLEFASPDAPLLSVNRDPETTDYALKLQIDSRPQNAHITFREKLT
jgi:hypothetical protein